MASTDFTELERRLWAAADQLWANTGLKPSEIALAWLLDLPADVVSIPGATQEATARSLGRALAVTLTDHGRQRLDKRFSG